MEKVGSSSCIGGRVLNIRMKTFTYKTIITVTLLLIAILLLMPRVWVSGTTIVTLSRSGVLTVKPMGCGTLAILRAVGVDIEKEGIGEMSSGYFVEQNDEDCDSDTSSPPWHKFRFLITRLVVKGGVTRI
ncbi:MAG: hypothetical protein LBH93_01205, partial [Chitinispirillales bacterium]|nr:hypothetical protein [Chitinispirillales bacterium]